MIAILDYGMGNLRSVQKGLERTGKPASIITRPEEILAAERLILPGVGAFADAMEHLCDHGLVEPIRQYVVSGRPLLGVCLGMQLLADISFEDGEHQGLGLIPGKVVRFDFSGDRPADRKKLKIPHMGWNQIQWSRPCPLLKGVEPGSYVYFVHSYHFAPSDKADTLATTDYGGAFVSMLWKDNLYACQFHPEKSQQVGLNILANFAGL